MSTRRMFVKIFTNNGRNPVKKCTFWKVLSLLCIAIICWSVFLLMNHSEFQHQPRLPMINNSLAFSEKSGASEHVDFMEIPAISDAFTYKELVQENPLGLYFSDKMGGRLPIGKSHLEYVKIKSNRRVKMVLIFVQNISAATEEIFGEFFARQRIEYRIRIVSKDLLPLVLEDIDVARYSLIVFDEYTNYLKMDHTRRGVLDSYCRKYNIGVLALTLSTGNPYKEVFNDQKLKIIRHVPLTKYALNPEAHIWRVGKVSARYLGRLPTSDWTIFITNHRTYRPLVFSSLVDKLGIFKDDVTMTDLGCVPVVHDQGLLDGIQRIILGYSLDFWLNAIVAMDAITYLTDGLFALPLARLLQVDIDDMFAGVSGTRTLVKDAKAMVASQEKISKQVPGFSYKLGFSGEFFLKGSQAEQEGDRAVVELASHFVWFDHLNRHERLVNLNRTGLQMSMDKNARFAKDHGLPISRNYMVPPYHAGVYPVYESLYDEWNDRQVTCTSTLAYPKQSPVWGRRGFIYRGVMVLPRVDCNLYTTVNRFEDLLGGKAGLDRSIHGDLLFKLFLYTPVLIFMTHMSNYANDQLGQYSFENEIEFVTKWTNLKLATDTPKQIARTYFQMYPNETEPMWTNPCEYNSKHQLILPPHVTCSKFPKFFILGTEKSGITVLKKLLETHPMLVGTRRNVTAIDDAHFFSGSTYLKGLDWYQKQFPEPANKGIFLFEASHHYLHDEQSPKRISVLVPRAKIVIVLTEPIVAALCCYHNLQLQLGVRNYTIYQAVGDKDTRIKSFPEIRSKCFKPMAYAVHLARWLQFFPKEQILIISRDQFSREPIGVMNQIERFVGVVPYIDFATKLRHDSKNNYVCCKDWTCLSSVGDKSCPECLNSVGEKRCPSLDGLSRRFLQDYFQDHNSNLRMLLDNLDQRYPPWLVETYPH